LPLTVLHDTIPTLHRTATIFFSLVHLLF